MRIFTEVFGGPDDGNLVQVNGDIYNSLDFAMLDITSNWSNLVSPNTIAELKEIQYRKSKAFFVFDKQYYFREFFVSKSSDQDRAVKNFRNYFNPVFKK